MRYKILIVAGWLVATSAGAQPFAYFTNRSDDTVSVIDTATRTIVGTVAVGDFPGGVAVAPDGSRVYVTNQSSPG